MDLIASGLIHFEKQEGNLCAQHALNALLQGPYFTAVDLAEIARKLDLDEQSVVRAGNRPRKSANYDDSGFFSIQVMQKALSIWNLEATPLGAEIVIEARNSPQFVNFFPSSLLVNSLSYRDEFAFICNLQEHWYTLRRFAVPTRWYNLNSTLKEPQWISGTYLGMMLQQIKAEGYSIFVIRGTLPQSNADKLAATLPPPTTLRAHTAGKESPFTGRGYSLLPPAPEPEPISGLGGEDWQIRAAIEASLREADTEGEKEEGERADRKGQEGKGKEKEEGMNMEEMRKKRLARFG
ncbi:ataxin-3-like protein [Endogone sp. FLAS-F59071]|nr:ataxin-3-like protein [Endogone sp. FLAS-F59071]|eukprot:RUS16564.1 ataxin-3-like protein [Endogone sp. FLAS-F59071]